MAKSTTHANQILDHLVGNSTWTAPSNLYISLHTANPGTTGASEVAGGSYARVSTSAATWDAAASGSVDNGTAITFAQGGGDAAVTHFGVWTASTSGTYLRGGTCTNFTYASNVTPEFAAGACVLSEA